MCSLVKNTSSLKKIHSLPNNESAAAPAELVFSLFYWRCSHLQANRDSAFSWKLQQAHFTRPSPLPNLGKQKEGNFCSPASTSFLSGLFIGLGSLEPEVCSKHMILCLSLLLKKKKRKTLFITLSKEALKEPHRYTHQIC